MRVSQNGGIPKWLVNKGTSHQIWWFGGYFSILRNLHMILCCNIHGEMIWNMKYQVWYSMFSIELNTNWLARHGPSWPPFAYQVGIEDCLHIEFEPLGASFWVHVPSPFLRVRKAWDGTCWDCGLSRSSGMTNRSTIWRMLSLERPRTSADSLGHCASENGKFPVWCFKDPHMLYIYIYI